MSKARSVRMSERQLDMLELKANGKSFSEIANIFSMSPAGAQTNIRHATNLLIRHGEAAFPVNRQSAFSVDELINAVPSAVRMRQLIGEGEARRNQPSFEPTSSKLAPPENNTLSVPTPFGTIQVTVKTDPNYPGVYIDLKGPNVNETFEAGAVGLAMVEFEPEKGKVQTVVYGDGKSEEPTHVIEHENILIQDRSKPALSDQIRGAEAKASQTDRTASSLEKGVSR